jgi:hypothetical protein
MKKHPSMDQVLLDRLHEVLESNMANEQFGVTELANEAGLSKSHACANPYSSSKSPERDAV